MRASFRNAAFVCALAALLAVPGLAAAQVVHSGVEAARVTPAGMVLVDATMPAPGAAVRLLYATQGHARPEVTVSVLVGDDAAGARAALAHFRQGVARELVESREVGDVTVRVDADQLGFVRDNVFVAVRRIEGTQDATAIAQALDGVVRGSPMGAPRVAQMSVRVGRPAATRNGRERIVPLVVSGGALVVSASRGLVLERIEARAGAPAPYHTSRGWFVRVRGERMPTDADFTVTAVDSQLRVSAR